MDLNLFILAFAGQIHVGDIIKSVNATNVAGEKPHEIEQMIRDRPACVFELQRSVNLTEPAQSGVDATRLEQYIPLQACVPRGENGKVGITFQVPFFVCML